MLGLSPREEIIVVFKGNQESNAYNTPGERVTKYPVCLLSSTCQLFDLFKTIGKKVPIT